MIPSLCFNEFEELHDYFCFGCNDLQPLYTTSKTIFICLEFAESLWGGNLSLPSSRFDSCGMKSEYWGGDEIIVPSSYWDTGYEFFRDVKVPLMEGYEI